MKKPVYIGVVYNDYTPQVENQLTRDLIMVSGMVAMRDRDIVIVSEDPRMDRLLSALNARRAYLPALPKVWFQYKTDELQPQIPAEAPLEVCTVVQRDLYQRVKEGHLDTAEQGAYYLPPQGRINPDVISLLRPAPNGFNYGDPMLTMMWG
ncbi:hypothetical protein [Burkholderia phage BCSR5]|nr:hypothetical protein [Burkholderia phage BCSR5]